MPLVTATALGEHIGLSRQRVTQLATEGVLKMLAGGKFDQDEARLAYIGFLREARPETTKSAAAANVQAARAEQIRLRTEKERGTLISITTVEATLEQIVGTFRAELAGVPSAASRDLTVRADIERVVTATIERCRFKLEALAETARAGGEIDVDGDEGGA